MILVSGSFPVYVSSSITFRSGSRMKTALRSLNESCPLRGMSFTARNRFTSLREPTLNETWVVPGYLLLTGERADRVHRALYPVG